MRTSGMWQLLPAAWLGLRVRQRRTRRAGCPGCIASWDGRKAMIRIPNLAAYWHSTHRLETELHLNRATVPVTPVGFKRFERRRPRGVGGGSGCRGGVQGVVGHLLA